MFSVRGRRSDKFVINYLWWYLAPKVFIEYVCEISEGIEGTYYFHHHSQNKNNFKKLCFRF